MLMTNCITGLTVKRYCDGAEILAQTPEHVVILRRCFAMTRRNEPSPAYLARVGPKKLIDPTLALLFRVMALLLIPGISGKSHRLTYCMMRD